MTRRWPSLVIAGLLASCISVDDFGAYWDKGFVDPALTGTWQKADSPVAEPDAVAAQRLDLHATGRELRGPRDEPRCAGKSRHASVHRALPQNRRRGVSDAPRSRQQEPGRDRRVRGPGPDVAGVRLETVAATRLGKIATLDDDTARALSQAIDDPGSWHVQIEYKKLGADMGGGTASGGLAAPPGSSLPPADRPQPQAVTRFDVTQARDVDTKFFIAGVGYVAIKGGGSVLAGMNRALDPFVELTIANRNDPVLQSCRSSLSPSEADKTAVRITGLGHDTRQPGVNDRYLVIVILDKLTDCRVVDRR